MPYAASIQSTTGTIASYAKKVAHTGRPEMEIILDDHTETKTYTTFDALSGNVKITAPHEARFDEIQITLEGCVRTYVENFSPHSTKACTRARHNFLKLTMPIRECDYPQPRLAEAGKPYSFPFNFVVPEHLLPRACSHPHTASHVQHAHLQLPPSMGDRSLSVKDDLSPEMTKIEYSIHVKVIRNRERDGKEMVLADTTKKLHIIPAVTEAPPMNIKAEDREYLLSKTKGLKKGMFSGKLGKITVSAAQPGALVLPAPSAQSTTQPATMTTVNLRFDPHEASSQPPRLGGLTTKIKVTTFYAIRPAADFPQHFSLQANFETQRGVYDTTVPLSSRCVESVSWTRHNPSPAYTRRGSASSTSSSDCSSDNICTPPEKSSLPFYTASILLPITLPTSKHWLPTFHSCIASRVYCIDLALTIHTPGTGVPASTVNLHLPVQVAADGNNGRRASLTAAEAAQELQAQEAQVEEYLRPRVTREFLSGEEGEGMVEEPPSYEDFAPSLLSRRARVVMA